MSNRAAASVRFQCKIASASGADPDLYFNADKEAEVEQVARPMVVKHSAWRAWGAAVEELNRTKRFYRGKQR